MTLPPPQLTDRDRFRLDCQNHLDARLHGGQGACLLRKALLAYMQENKHDPRDLDELMVEALDQCPVRRITPKVLERYRLIAVPIRSPYAPKQLYPDSASGHEYRYHALLREHTHECQPQVLVLRKPTWEPSTNVRSEDLRALHDQHRDVRSERRGN